MRRLIAFLVVLVTMVLPVSAESATVECAELSPNRDICEVVYEAGRAERNALAVTVRGGRVTFGDPAGVDAGRGCTQLASAVARCSLGSEPVIVRLGDRDDSLVVRGAFAPGPGLDASGGPGDDRLSGGRGNEGLGGGTGDDRLAGHVGDDSLTAGPGAGTDVLVGGRGNDGLAGNRGVNRLEGGPGRDSLQGGGGADVLRARDRAIDTVSCGRGRESVSLDALDWVARGCSFRPRRRAAAAPVGDSIDEDDDDFVNHLVEIGCPADGPARCRGRVRVIAAGRLLLRGRFSIPAGAIRPVVLREPRGFERPDRQRRVPARVTAAGRDRDGRPARRSIRLPFLIDTEEGIR